jgi:hypothetical protein
MLVSCSWATTLVAQGALTGIQLETEFAQTGQRQARDLRDRHRRGLVLGHPDRQMCQRAIRLADGQGDFVAVAMAPHDHGRIPAPRMERVADDHLAQPIVSIMKLPRQHPAGS